MLETQEILNLETGTIESEKLAPKNVKIVEIRVEAVSKDEKKIGDKAVFVVKHPDKEDTIEISSVEYRKGKEIRTSGLWVGLDKEGKLQKGSALALLKDFYKAKVLSDLKDKELPTTEDDRGYLCFKAY